MHASLTHVDAIIFDLGNVLVNLNFARMAQAFVNLGAQNFQAHWTPARQEGFFEAFERGELDAAQFRDKLRASLRLPATSDAALDAAWCSMLVDFPAKNEALLRQLKKRYRIFLLSNTNTIHVQQVETICRGPLSAYFENVYYSHHIGARKPEAKAFTSVIQAHQLVPARTAFIDDMPANTDAAQSLGLQAIHLAAGVPVSALFAPEF